MLCFGSCLLIGQHSLYGRLHKACRPPALVAQSDVRPTGDQVVACLIPAGFRLHFFVKIDHEKYFLPLVDSRRAVDNFWQKKVHKYWLTTLRTKPT